jgi:hypothetical protein
LNLPQVVEIRKSLFEFESKERSVSNSSSRYLGDTRLKGNPMTTHIAEELASDAEATAAFILLFENPEPTLGCRAQTVYHDSRTSDSTLAAKLLSKQSFGIASAENRQHSRKVHKGKPYEASTRSRRKEHYYE